MKAKSHRWLFGASLITALVSSLCCIGPLVLAGLGLGSFAAASWFAAWRSAALAVTFGLLAAGWYAALRRRCTGAFASVDGPRRATIVLLALATVTATLLAAYPWIVGRLATAAPVSPAPTRSTVAGSVAVLRVRIPSMDCEACAASIAASLRRLSGVLSAEIIYATREATVRFDLHASDAETITAAIAATGFPSEPSNPSAP